MLMALQQTQQGQSSEGLAPHKPFRIGMMAGLLYARRQCHSTQLRVPGYKDTQELWLKTRDLVGEDPDLNQ